MIPQVSENQRFKKNLTKCDLNTLVDISKDMIFSGQRLMKSLKTKASRCVSHIISKQSDDTVLLMLWYSQAFVLLIYNHNRYQNSENYMKL